MEGAGPEELRAIWADATPLEDCIEALARDLKEKHGTYTSAHKTARREIVGDFVANRLSAYGRREKVSDKIEWIRAEYWIDCDLSKSDDSISRDDYGKFVSIRVVLEPIFIVGRKIEPDREPIRSRNPGRPSTRPRIILLARKLLKNLEFRSLDRTRQSEEIRAKLEGEEMRKIHGLRGYSDRHISRILGELDEDEKGSA